MLFRSSQMKYENLIQRSDKEFKRLTPARSPRRGPLPMTGYWSGQAICSHLPKHLSHHRVLRSSCTGQSSAAHQAEKGLSDDRRRRQPSTCSGNGQQDTAIDAAEQHSGSSSLGVESAGGEEHSEAVVVEVAEAAGCACEVSVDFAGQVAFETVADLAECASLWWHNARIFGCGGPSTYR